MKLVPTGESTIGGKVMYQRVLMMVDTNYGREPIGCIHVDDLEMADADIAKRVRDGYTVDVKLTVVEVQT